MPPTGDAASWQARFEAGTTGWDRGGPGPHLPVWLADGTLDPAVSPRVVVPGCGSGHDVVALARAGFTVTGLDFAPAAVEATRRRLDEAGLTATVELADVLTWSPPEPVDAVYEQTCLCALHPDSWTAYAARLAGWLRPGGVLAALLMQSRRPGAEVGQLHGPPFHCDVHAVRALLPEPTWAWPAAPYPRVEHPRAGYELAVALTRRG